MWGRNTVKINSCSIKTPCNSCSIKTPCGVLMEQELILTELCGVLMEQELILTELRPFELSHFRDFFLYSSQGALRFAPLSVCMFVCPSGRHTQRHRVCVINASCSLQWIFFTTFYAPLPRDDSQGALRFAPVCLSVCPSGRHTLSIEFV